jgi:hypothetical protein
VSLILGCAACLLAWLLAWLLAAAAAHARLACLLTLCGLPTLTRSPPPHLCSKLLPPGLVSAIQDGPGEAAVAALGTASETPERVWNRGMQRAAAEEVADLAATARAQQARPVSDAGGVGGSTRWRRQCRRCTGQHLPHLLPAPRPFPPSRRPPVRWSGSCLTASTCATPSWRMSWRWAASTSASFSRTPAAPSGACPASLC